MKKPSLLLLVAALVGAFFALDLGRWLALDALKASQATFAAWYDARPLPVLGASFA